MTTIFQCPRKKIKSLVFGTNPYVFEFLSKEPGKNGTDRIYRTNHPYATEQELEEFYRRAVRAYDKTQKIAFELSKYDGKFRGNWNEIFFNLRQHVIKCNSCFEAYKEFIEEKTSRCMYELVHNSPQIFIKSSGLKEISDKVQRKIDKEHLQLADYLF